MEHTNDPDLIRLIKYLQINPLKRKQSHTNEAMHYFQHIPFFDKYISEGNIDLVQKCVKNMTYQYIEADQILSAANTKMNRLYFLLQGSVEIVIQEEKALIDIPKEYSLYQKSKVFSCLISDNGIDCNIESDRLLDSLDRTRRQINDHQEQIQQTQKLIQLKQKEIANKEKAEANNNNNGNISLVSLNQKKLLQSQLESLNASFIALKDELLKLIEEQQILEKIKIKHYISIKRYTKMQLIGDESAINQEFSLSTIITSNNCHLAVLDKQVYNQFRSKEEKDQQILDQNLFYNLWLFEKWSQKKAHLIYMIIQKRKVINNQMIFDENTSVQEIYIIKKGQFALQKCYSTLVKSNEQEQSQQQKNRNIVIQNYFNQSTIMKQFTIMIMHEGEIFGEEDLLENREQHTYSVTCKSQVGEIYVMQIIDFNKRLRADFSRESIIQNHYKKKKKLISTVEDKINQLISKEGQYLHNQKINGITNEQYRIKTEESIRNDEISREYYRRKNNSNQNLIENMMPLNVNLDRLRYIKYQNNDAFQQEKRVLQRDRINNYTSDRIRNNKSYINLPNQLSFFQNISKGNIRNINSATICQSQIGVGSLISQQQQSFYPKAYNKIQNHQQLPQQANKMSKSMIISNKLDNQQQANQQESRIQNLKLNDQPKSLINSKLVVRMKRSISANTNMKGKK